MNISCTKEVVGERLTRKGLVAEPAHGAVRPPPGGRDDQTSVLVAANSHRIGAEVTAAVAGALAASSAEKHSQR